MSKLGPDVTVEKFRVYWLALEVKRSQMVLTDENEQEIGRGHGIFVRSQVLLSETSGYISKNQDTYQSTSHKRTCITAYLVIFDHSCVKIPNLSSKKTVSVVCFNLLYNAHAHSLWLNIVYCPTTY